MSQMTVFSSPLLLGFEPLAQLLEAATKAGDSYPPYNIERLVESQVEVWRLSLAVAGFSAATLQVTREEQQLIIRGRNQDENKRDFLHRGIAARSFVRRFFVADDMEVLGASLENGLLVIELKRRQLERPVQRIDIVEI